MDYLNSKININKEISNWIYRYITAQKYNLHYMTGKIDIKTGNYFPKLMRAKATAENVKIKFHKNLNSTDSKKVYITLKNDTLYFKLYKPMYEGIDLNGSKVTITNLLSKGSAIEVILKAKHSLDKKVKQILKAYNVDIPLYQKTSSTNALLRLYIPFVPYSFHIKGYFYTQNSDIYFKKVKFHTKKAKILLDDNTVKLENTNISYNKLFDINTTGTFYTSKNLFSGNIDINKLYLKYKNELILDANRTKSKVNVTFDKNTVFLKDLNTTLVFGKIKNFTFGNLQKLYKISPFLKKYNIKQGNAKISTKNFNLFYLKSHIHFNDNKILLYNDKLLKNFDINGTINTKNIKLNINKNLISADISDRITINTNKISYDFRNSLNNNSKEYYFKKPITLNAFDSTIYISKEIILPTTSFTLFLNKDKKIFSGIYGKNHIFYSKDFKMVDIHTNFLSADYINTIIQHNLFRKGGFLLTIKESNDLFWGNCKISDSMVKSPKKGGSDFKIDTGEFNFYLKNSLLTLKDIILKNKFTTLKGEGYIDLKNKRLNLVFKVNILKSLGKTIKAIPLIGYVFLGKNGKFSSKVTITGDFKNPQVQTDFSKDIIKSPLGIIFRVIKLPFKLLLPKTNPSK